MTVQRIAILNDYVRIPYANGSSFASQRLYREFVRRGHEVTVIGPEDPAATPRDLPRRYLLLPSLPLRNHPGVYLPFPSPEALARVAAAGFDVALGQAGSAFVALGPWLRARAGVPFLGVHTVHLPSIYNVVLPPSLHGNRTIHWLFRDHIIPRLERYAANLYNRGDGLIVLSRGLHDYWRARGVEVPIHVIPRSIDTAIFDGQRRADPFDPRATPGARLFCLCRHTREKSVDRLLRLFAAHVAPAHPGATLTLAGDGPDHDEYRALADRLGVGARVFFPGEIAARQAPQWYLHADLFVYASLSETYGQVVSEALYCGLPVVALADGMGVSHQIQHGKDGLLVDPRTDSDPGAADREFAAAVLGLLRDRARLRAYGETAARTAADRCAPARAVERHDEAFAAAREHLVANPGRLGRLRRAGLLGNWTFVHLLACAVGLLRKPALLNRNQAPPPDWDEPDAATSPAR